MNKSIDQNFEEVFERIKEETDVKSLRQLAKIIKKDQSTISFAKAKNNFPANWAYEIEKKYGLLTGWILTVEGPKTLNEKKGNSDFYAELEEWAKEMSMSEDIRWLYKQIEEHFPGFVEWKKRKAESGNSGDGFASSKVA